MACLDKETATAYLRGDLDPHQAALCAAHVADCDTCRQIVEEISALMDHARDALRELEDPSDAPDWSRIARGIDRAIAWQPPRVRWSMPQWGARWAMPRWRLAPVPLFVSLMFVAVLGAFVYEQRHAERTGSPAPASVGSPTRPRAVSDIELPAATPTPTPVRTLSRAAQLALEVRALSLLDGAGALLGEQVNVRRAPNGVRVEVTVDSDQRRLEIARALAPIVGTPGVQIRLQTFASAARNRPEAAREIEAPLRMREVQVQRDDFPAAPIVRDALRAAHPEKDAGAIDQDTRQLAARATEQSQLALQHAWAVVRLASRYAPAEVASTLPADARQTWHAMIQLHAREVAAQVAGLGETLQPLLPDSTQHSDTAPRADAAAVAETPTGTNRAHATEPASIDARELAQVANRLVTLAQMQDEIVRASFSASADTPATASILSPELRSTRQELIRLARQISD